MTLPATAATATPLDAGSITSPVTGRELTISGVTIAAPLTVTTTDAAGSVARWVVPWDSERGGSVTLDVWSPGTGTAPVNGETAITVSAADEELLSTVVVLDVTPTSPSLAATVDGSTARLRWDAVAGPGVRYRLQRSSSGAWTTLHDGASADAVADRGLAHGTYRYRLTAAVAAAGTGTNESEATTASVTVVAPKPTPRPRSTAEPAAAKLPKVKLPTAAQKVTTPDLPRSERRRVAASGGVRGPVDGRPTQALRPNSSPLSSGTALAPAVSAPGGRGVQWQSPIAPEVAEEQWLPQVAPPRFEPVALPPPGMLAVEAGAAAAASPEGPARAVAVLLGLVGLFIVSMVTPRRLLLIRRGDTELPTP